ncbi:MAG: hypothetical protein ACOCWG_01155 [bacterium]
MSNKNKILFFSRCDLPKLYGRLHKYLENHFEVMHLAYSDREASVLQKDFKISDVINFKNKTEEIFKTETLDIQLCERIDKEIIASTNGRFCLNSAIQSDRTFQFINYEECLILCQVYYKFWQNLIKDQGFNIIIHEPTALFFTQIAAVLCKMHGGKYLSQIQMKGEDKYNWLFVEGDDGTPIELNGLLKKGKNLTQEENARVKAFLNEFRADKTVFFNQISQKGRVKGQEKVLSFFVHLVKTVLKRTLKYKIGGKRKDFSSIDHMEKFYFNYDKMSLKYRLIEKWEKYFKLEFDVFDSSLNYYYYPMHLEPEAVVLYWGDGLYKNQIKLIENIAAQLPPGNYLLVKDHPHAGLNRHFRDYKRIKAIPNVKLLNPTIPGKEIAKEAKGVITINGTGGFEAILFNKPVYTFGNSFYKECKRAFYVNNIKELRTLLYSHQNYSSHDDSDLYEFIFGYLNSLHKGFVSYFSNRATLFNVDEETNAKQISESIIRLLKNGN